MQNIVLMKLCIFESSWHFLFCHEGTKALGLTKFLLLYITQPLIRIINYFVILYFICIFRLTPSLFIEIMSIIVTYTNQDIDTIYYKTSNSLIKTKSYKIFVEEKFEIQFFSINVSSI